MKAILILLNLLPVFNSFQMSRLKSTTSSVRLFAVEGEKNADVFGAPPPVSISESNGDIDVDFDALSKESAANTFKPKVDLSNMYTKEERRAPRQSQWFPMLLSPVALDGSLAGDVGFDPFGLARDKEGAYRMREAELKHSRLAMLAAAGWPLSELWHRELADTLGLDSILASENRAPSVLNGGKLFVCLSIYVSIYLSVGFVF
jgi:hypothetical protein